MKSLGEELREAREKAGYTLKEVENKVGVSNSYLSELERNIKTNPSNELLKKLSDLYSYNYLKLFLRKGQTNSESNKYDFMYEALLDLISIEELDNLTEKEKTIAKFVSFQIKDYKPSITEVKELLLSKDNNYNKPMFTENDISKKEIQNAIEAVYSDLSNIEKIPVINNVELDNLIKNENIIDYEKAPTETFKNGEYFYYKINDDSMINAGILKNDIVLVRKQDKVRHKNIVLIVDESNNTTLKRVFIDNETYIFQSENPSYDPIVDANNKIKIIGKVISLKRRFE